jgi:hypothetical protein
MKLLLIFTLFSTSVVAYSQSHSPEASRASQTLLERKQEKTINSETPYREKMRQEDIRRNDDFDPQEDAIDDDLTKDEGMEDD